MQRINKSFLLLHVDGMHVSTIFSKTFQTKTSMVQFLCKQSLEKKQEAVKKGQSRDTFNIVYKRRHRTKNNKTKNTTQKTKNIEQHRP